MSKLHYQENKVVNAKPSRMDQDIRSMIEQNQSEDFTELLSEEYRWEVFYHLSSLRSSLLNWFEFRPGAKVLEIGGEFGALTGTLCDKCSLVSVVESDPFRAETIQLRYRTRENLDIYVADLLEFSVEDKFDYITVIGLLEYLGKGTADKKVYSEYLQNLSKLLKEDGSIIIAVENRYGLKYFCGAEEPHTGRPYDGINKYAGGTKGYSFSRQELMDILEEAGFRYRKFYYPLPDYKLPQLIYTDQYLPQKNLQERLIPYYLNADTLLAQEMRLYDDLIDNGVFPFFSNSFLVECSRQEVFCSVISAAISTDRGKENGFATTIHSDSTVRKTAIYNEGIENLSRIYDNVKDLQQHGIPVIPHQLEEGVIRMPFNRAPSLSNVMRDIVKTDLEQFLLILDQLYRYILSSSEPVSSEKNALMTEATKELDWGVILNKAYIELIPLNCFYDQGQLIFFDQEFVRENYPAKFVLFRAIHYIYGFAPFINSILPLNKLKEKYNLVELWELFLMEEQRFIKEIRQSNKYSQFYQWARIDWNRIRDNSLMLSYQGESIVTFDSTLRLKNIQEKQFDLLMELKKICENNDIRYFMIYGTLLGAVRHKGFIPWDDDIDIALPREDYERLLAIAPDQFRKPYFLQTPENDPECFYGGYSKLRNCDTTAMELVNWGHACNHGIWIDIFPLDHSFTEKRKERKKVKKIQYYQRLIFAKVYSKAGCLRDVKTFEWSCYRTITKLYSQTTLYEKLNTAFQVGDLDSEKYGIYTHYTGKKQVRRYLKEDFNAAHHMLFGNTRLPAPIGYHRCLQTSAGLRYMQYPPVEQRRPHHKAFFAPEVPYKAYQARFFDTFKEIEGKTVVLFGAGLMFEDYMQKYGLRYKPEFLVDNNTAKWGSEKLGIIIKDPQELQRINKDKLHLIICNIYYRQIELQLQKMGISNYYIYVQNKDWLTSDPK